MDNLHLENTGFKDQEAFFRYRESGYTPMLFCLAICVNRIENLMSRYNHIEPWKNISHLTRINRTPNSSKTIVPRKIVEGLDLRYNDDYLEWRMEMGWVRKVAIVRKFREGSVLYSMTSYT